MVYSVLGVLNIMDMEHIVIYLLVYLLSQVFIGVVVFNYLLKNTTDKFLRGTGHRKEKGY